MTREESFRFRLAQFEERAKNAHKYLREAFRDAAEDLQWAIDEIESLRKQVKELQEN